MKFLIPLLSFFLGNAKSFFGGPSQAITQQVVLRVRAITILAICAIGSLALSCVGLSLLIAKIATQLDSPEGFVWTTGTSVYLGMTLLFVGALVITMLRSTWLSSGGFNPQKEAPRKGGSPIENAIALVVMDFLEERQQRRQKNENRSA
ncbi:hypothetical protein AZI86_17330 [Bdellovibrio bacteriovorus]|uniref:Uncharacterized protein n=1 Tax=Bdellovibrio bacteriovorus TaxID=959 RepID=A0A150WEZ1_BDEBC|nr:hypothetical protein [Bdellovibrio bacteriovorus]KYG61475.1 hypothetical protein AZI86_17330 [Bdellovibrio bacteriovorus]